ncbi:MAG: BamA/TamA family outer membrane protein [Rubrivivax sp.]|jgi:translocation and assembly module TamA|nr:BamA/TamA family outer membrane protein [Rubrivivax sp.]
MSPVPGRWLGRILLAAAALASSGCALLGGRPLQAMDTPAAPPGPPALEIEIDAPPELRALLERHLDLARLATVARGERLGDSELSRLIDAAPAQARELLQTEGYFEPEMQIQQRTPETPDGPPRLRLQLQPGPRTKISQVDLQLSGAWAEAAQAGRTDATQALQGLRQHWPLKTGAPFRNPAWADAKTESLARLRASGHLAASWSRTSAEIDPALGQARLSLSADPGPLFLSGELRVEGLRLHDRETVGHLANFGPGTPLTETLLLDFQDRLQKSGLFERASVAVEATTDQAAAAPVSVQVEESARQQLVLGVGVSANTGPRATVEHIDRRLFGRAATSRNKAEWGGARQAWDGEISTHPGPRLYRWLAGGTVERLQTDTDVVLTQRLRAGRNQDSPRIERFQFIEVDRSARKTDSEASSSVAVSANHHWAWRDVDNPVLPTRGLTASLQTGLGQAWDSTGLNGGFGRAWGRVTGYLPLGAKWYAQARLEAGQVLAPAGLDVPDTLRFRAGGDDSVRGYAYRSLGPSSGGTVDSGKVILTTSVELARPLSDSLPQFWGAVFVDAGQAADRFSDLRPVVGAGVGLRWRSPVGPLRLDWAYGEAVRKSRLHFSVGISF